MKAKLILASVIALTAHGAIAEEIRVLNWQGYGTDLEWAVQEFTDATGTTVIHEYFNSEQEMLTKRRTNPDAYDVVMINAAFTARARAEGLLVPIDVGAVPNYSGISADFADNASLSDGAMVWGVPWTWGWGWGWELTSFAINSQSVDPVPTSLEVFWDPAYAGRVSIRDDAFEAV